MYSPIKLEHLYAISQDSFAMFYPATSLILRNFSSPHRYELARDLKGSSPWGRMAAITVGHGTQLMLENTDNETQLKIRKK